VEMRLTCEFVPKTLQNKGLSVMLKGRMWSLISRTVKEINGYKCVVCGDCFWLITHEIWEYDDEKLVQRLAGFMTLCSLCHRVKHMQGSLLRTGRDWNKICYIRKFMRINGISWGECKSYLEAKLREWGVRSTKNWTIDYGVFGKHIRVEVPAIRTNWLGNYMKVEKSESRKFGKVGMWENYYREIWDIVH